MHFQVSATCQSKQMSCSLSLTLQPFYGFTAVSVHTVSEIYPWGDHRALPEAFENGSQEINSKMSEELSVGKDTLVIATFGSIFSATPTALHPQDEQYFPTVKRLSCVSSSFYIMRYICWYHCHSKKLWFMANSSPIQTWNMLTMRCLN